MKKALITGITGQDGSYLAEFLLKKGYQVHGIVKRETLEEQSGKMHNVLPIVNEIVFHEGSLIDHLSLYKTIQAIQPDECYHLSAHSFVNYSLSEELDAMHYNFDSTHHLLSVLNEVCPQCKFFLAGSSEMFGEPDVSPQIETSRHNPKSIYGISRVASASLVKNYRHKASLFACTGILYNHESPRRGHAFVTRKITSTVAKISLGLEKKLTLGNIDAQRDWGYAPSYVEAMWKMLQAKSPEDYIIATGILHSVRDFLQMAFGYVGLDYQKYVEIDAKFYRPSEDIPLCGNPTKIKEALQWECTKPLKAIVEEMVENDLQCFKRKG